MLKCSGAAQAARFCTERCAQTGRLTPFRYKETYFEARLKLASFLPASILALRPLVSADRY